MLNNNEIYNLIDEHKTIDSATIRSAHKEQNFKNKQNLSFKIWEHELQTVGGNVFRIKIHRNKRFIDNFSVIFQYIDENEKSFNLKRYNGIHAPHINTIEKNRVQGFHIHTATERYQEKNLHIEAYAEETDQYSDWKGAFIKLLHDCNIKQNEQHLHTFVEDS